MDRTTVEAGHESRCAVCDETIPKGAEIVLLPEDDEWVHADCVEGE